MQYLPNGIGVGKNVRNIVPCLGEGRDAAILIDPVLAGVVSGKDKTVIAFELIQKEP